MEPAAGLIITLLNTYLPILSAALVLWILLKVFQEDIKSARETLIKELKSLAKLQWSLKSLNALVTILAAVLVLLLPRSIVLPTPKDAIDGLFLLGAVLAFLVVFVILAIACLQIVRHERQ